MVALLLWFGLIIRRDFRGGLRSRDDRVAFLTHSAVVGVLGAILASGPLILLLGDEAKPFLMWFGLGASISVVTMLIARFLWRHDEGEE